MFASRSTRIRATIVLVVAGVKREIFVSKVVAGDAINITNDLCVGGDAIKLLTIAVYGFFTSACYVSALLFTHSYRFRICFLLLLRFLRLL